GRPRPSEVRTSMFHAAMSASLMGCPNPAAGGPGAVAGGGVVAQAAARTSAVIKAARLRDRILDLAGRAHGPGEDTVVVLHEAADGADLRDVLDGRLHVPGAVHRAARDHGGAPVPLPAVAEAREHLVEHGPFDHRLLPVLAAVDGDIDGGDPAAARPCEA